MKWTEDEIFKLRELKRKGIPYKEIAHRLGRTVLACQTMIHNCNCHIDIISEKIREKKLKQMSREEVEKLCCMTEEERNKILYGE